MKHLSSLFSVLVIVLLSNCKFDGEEAAKVVSKDEKQTNRAYLSEDQLRKINEEGSNFISFLSKSEIFDGTYNLKSDRFLLYLSSINRRPIFHGYEKEEIVEFIRFVGVEEQDYVQRQAESESDLKLNVQKAGRPTLITRGSMAPALDELGRFRFEKYLDHYKGWLYFNSTPNFSKDQRYVLVGHGFYCGALCGGGYTEIYEKVSAKEWKRIKVISEWAS